MNWDQLKELNGLVGWVAALVSLFGAVVAIYSARLAARSAARVAQDQSNRIVRRPIYDDFLDRVDELVHAVDWERRMHGSMPVVVRLVPGDVQPEPDPVLFRESHWRHREICELLDEARRSALTIHRDGSSRAALLADRIVRTAARTISQAETDHESGETFALLSTRLVVEGDAAECLRELRNEFRDTRRRELLGE